MLVALETLALRFGTLFLVGAVVLARLVVFSSPKGSPRRSRFRFAFVLFLVHLIVLITAAGIDAADGNLADESRIAVGLTATIAAVMLGSVIVFEGLVHRISPKLPRIVPDVVTALVVFIGILRASSQLGLELSGLIATSAVLTAVLGLSLQDTLGNIFGGLALQLDSSFAVGDWVKVGDVVGKVVEIGWRATTIETRNWETVLVPNSVVTRANVMILGRRTNEPVQLRRWVWFQVDFRRAPNDVVEAVERALRAQPIPNVAATPPPNCVAMEFGESSTRYAVRYWLTDIAVDDPTDSLVRTRIHYALARAGWMFAIPAQALFVTNDDAERVATKAAAEKSRRVAALRATDIFRDLTDEERDGLAADLRSAPFVKGETITREGSEAHHLYMILEGEISVRVGFVPASHEFARLRAGEFFGEMALLTGEPRRATTIAVEDVDCYRLEAGSFRALLSRRPDLAERLAKILVDREEGLVAVREKVDAEQRAARRTQSERALLGRIRSFFELD